MRLVFFFFFFFILPFLNCSSFSILRLINDAIDRNTLRINHNYYNFLWFVQQQGTSFQPLLELLEDEYHQNTSILSESARWQAAIDFAVKILADEQPDTLEDIFNRHLIPAHPFRPYFIHPFTVNELQTNLGSYFAEMEYEIFNSRIREILYDTYYSSDIYSPSHISFLNLLFDFGNMRMSRDDPTIKYHLSFLFRASFTDFNFVVHNVYTMTYQNQQPDFGQLAESIFEGLFKKDKEQARLALKFAVNVRSTDLSHLSYSACIREYAERQLMPMLPQTLASSLKSRNSQSMKLPIDWQMKLVEHLKTVIQHDIFWLVYNEFYFEPFKFDYLDREHFWWSFLYSLVHKFDEAFRRQIFAETSNSQLLMELKAPILESERFFEFEAKESDLFRSVLVNGHHATVTVLLENLNGDFSEIFPQIRVDWILRFAALYATADTTNFLLSLSEFKYSLKAFEYFLLTCASHGKSSLLLEYPTYLTDEMLIRAASKGHFDVVTKLLLAVREFSQGAIVEVASIAFQANDLVFLKEILRLSNNLKLNLRSLPFLFQLFSANDVEICDLIVDSIYFTDEETLEIVRHASHAAFDLQQPEVLERILDDAELFFDQRAQGQVLLSAINAAFPDLQLLRSIISEFGFVFSKVIRKQAIAIALKSPKATEIVPVLLEFPSIFGDNESSMFFTLLTALKLNFFFEEIVVAWQNRLTPFVFTCLLQEACQHRKIDAIEVILKTSDPSIYPAETRNSLLFLAANEGNLNWVKFITNCGFEFSLRSLEKAADLAKKHRNIQKYLQSILNK